MTTDRPGGRSDSAGDGSAGDDGGKVDTSHLDDVEDGCGCAEVWDHLSEQRGD